MQNSAVTAENSAITLLTEDQSAALAGVSIETIRQYAGYGLLEKQERNGLVRFRESEIRSLFHTAKRVEAVVPEPSQQEVPIGSAPTVEVELQADLSSDRQDSAEQPSSTPQPTAPRTEFANTELANFGSEAPVPAVQQVIEINRSLRDQVEQLRNERDWLRTRLEKLETRSEREQMLVISESETIRSFIRQQQKRRSFWSFALPWLRQN